MKKLNLVFLFLSFWFINETESQWLQLNLPTTLTVDGVNSPGSYLFAVTNNGIFVSSDSGVNWKTSNNGLTDLHVNSVCNSGNRVFIGSPSGIFCSTNFGSIWFQTGYTSHINAIGIYDTDIYGCSPYGLYKSTNNGINWNEIFNQSSISVCITPQYYFTGKFGVNGGIYRSTNNGLNWIRMSLTDDKIWSILNIENVQFAGTSFNGVYKSTNNGLNWVNCGLETEIEVRLIKYNNNIFAGSRDHLFYTTDLGTNWISLLNTPAYSLYIDNNYIFVGSANGKIYRRILSDIIGLTNEYLNITSFSLSQNYPNPFNPVTKIRFSIPQNETTLRGITTSLIVYDALGKEVAILVNRQLQPGTYEAEWDASAYPSGVYYYMLEGGDYSDTKKMILIK